MWKAFLVIEDITFVTHNRFEWAFKLLFDQRIFIQINWLESNNGPLKEYNSAVIIVICLKPREKKNYSCWKTGHVKWPIAKWFRARHI